MFLFLFLFFLFYQITLYFLDLKNIYYVVYSNNNSTLVRNFWNEKFKLYNFSNSNLYINQKVLITGKISIDQFNNNVLYVENFEELRNFDISFYFLKWLQNKDVKYKNYIIPILFGYISDSKIDLFKISKELGILHLLIISGFHFNILFFIFLKIFKSRKSFAILSIFCYWYICNKTVSVNRAFLSVVIPLFFKRKSSIFDIIISQILILCLMQNISLNNMGYWLSFLITIYLKIINKLWNQNKFKNILTIFLTWMFSISLIILFQGEFNLFSILNITLLTPIFEINFLLILLTFPIKIFCLTILDNFLSFINLFKNFVFIIEINRYILWIPFLLQILFLFFISTKKQK